LVTHQLDRLSDTSPVKATSANTIPCPGTVVATPGLVGY
jgi:hypothetical protein